MSGEEEQGLPAQNVEDKVGEESGKVVEPTPSGQRAFNVRPVTFDVAPDAKTPREEEKVKQTEDEDDEDDEVRILNRTTSGDPDFTMGYTTNEAVPMTVFYRNDTTHGPTNRPSLQQLRKGLQPEGKSDSPPGEDAESAKKAEPQVPGPTNGAPKFDWIRGVLFGCLLNIWGVILYLRLTWVIGQAGIGLGSIVILLSATVTIMTTLSMSAICTNGEVKGGGAYFLISRTLGPQFGGSIGLVFSVANAVAAAMYVVGFAETVRDLLKDNDALMIDELNDIRIIGCITVILLLGVTLVGMRWVMRTQVFLLVILVVSIINVIVGTFIGPQNHTSEARGFLGYKHDVFKSNFGPDFKGENFFSVFAVFFPAATGILAGVNISGDLKNVQKAVPKGTLLAILISTVVYLILGWMMGSVYLREALGEVVLAANETMPSCTTQGCSEYGLLNDFQVMMKVSGWGPIVTAGIFASTLSSALASLVGGPKTFQAVCKDKLFPKIYVFAKGYGPGNEPRRAYLLGFVIAVAFIIIADLNIIAPIISNFFLVVYALINYAVFSASLSRSPGWRPSFKFYSMWVSLVGSLLCVVIMFLINWWAALVTIVIVFMLYLYLEKNKPEVNWGSSGQALKFTRALKTNLQLDNMDDHVKNFRPQCLVLTGRPSQRPDLAYLVSHMTKNIGLMMYGDVSVKGFIATSEKEVEDDKLWLQNRKIKAFRASCSAPTLRDGVRSMLQLSGLGKMKPNTVVLGFKNDWKTATEQAIEEYVGIINEAFELNCGLAILRLNKGKLVGDDELSSESELAKEDVDEGTRKRTIKQEECGSPEAESLTANVEQVDASPDDIKAMFESKQKGEIHVWWLYDDGGLTMLIPYLLTLHRWWRDCKLCIFSVDMRSKHGVDKSQVRMANLIKKFRFDVSSVNQLKDGSKRPSEDNIETFKKFHSSMCLNDDEVEDQKPLRMIRIGEMVREHSREAQLVILSMPVSKLDVTSPLMYMSWLEVLSADLPPVLLVRGNQTNVLTFYS